MFRRPDNPVVRRGRRASQRQYDRRTAEIRRNSASSNVTEEKCVDRDFDPVQLARIFCFGTPAQVFDALHAIRDFSFRALHLSVVGAARRAVDDDSTHLLSLLTVIKHRGQPTEEDKSSFKSLAKAPLLYHRSGNPIDKERQRISAIIRQINTILG